MTAPRGALGTTPGFPPLLLSVGERGGQSDTFRGGCPWDISAALRGAVFLSVCRPGFYEGSGPYQVALSRAPFDGYDVIAEDSAPLGSPTISPDGNWVAFDVFRDKEPPSLAIVRPDGTDRRVLADGHYSAAWAPDSRRLIARNNATGALDIVDLHGRTTRLALGTSAAWQPHGRLIAYIGPGGRLIVSRNDGKQRRVFGPAEQNTPAWSPDGRALAYVSESDRLSHGLLLWNSRTHRTRVLVRHAGYQPTWSPDSRFVAVLGAPYTTSVGYGLVSVARAGGHASLLYPSGSVSRAGWLRTGRIAFVQGP